MMGAKDLVRGEDTRGGATLQFKIGRNASGGNKIRISLAPDDTYSIELWHVKGTNVFQVGETVKGVYVDSLKRTLESLTGLRCSL